MLVGVLLGLVLVQPTRSESPPCQGGDGADVIEPSEVYRVGPGDILQVTVHDTKDLRRTLATVQHGGDISFPLLGKIPVSGLSIAEVQDRLEELLSKDSPGNPQIEVKMKEYRSQWVAVSGEVARPGKYYLTGRKTLHELNRGGRPYGEG